MKKQFFALTFGVILLQFGAMAPSRMKRCTRVV